MTITKRIDELREYARVDGELFNESSIADFLAFPAIAGIEGPYLFLEEDGNLRALWRNTAVRLGIDFYGRGKARLSVFPLGGKRSEVSRFDLAGIPPELEVENFLAFVKEHLSEIGEEAVLG